MRQMDEEDALPLLRSKREACLNIMILAPHTLASQTQPLEFESCCVAQTQSPTVERKYQTPVIDTSSACIISENSVEGNGETFAAERSLEYPSRRRTAVTCCSTRRISSANVECEEHPMGPKVKTETFV